MRIDGRVPAALAAVAAARLLAPAAVHAQANEPSGAQIAQACAPPPTFAVMPANRPRVIGGQDVVERTLFGVGDLVVVNAGSSAGLALDQRYVLRRPVLFGGLGMNPSKVAGMSQTSGWVRIVAVNGATAIARIDVACEGVLAGDYLEPYAAPAEVDASAPAGEADFTTLAHVLWGQAETRLGGAGNFMLIDQGRRQGVTPGTRVAIYRDLRSPGLPLVAVGEGVIVSASDRHAVMRILSSRSAVESGDFVARRPAGAPAPAAN